ncbi:MAG: amino acid ABC transporter substrate-binding protein [Spirochaetaceae bacterium]|nr:MAG: amino acid ABC transporter substrate-binding protein [Spirochaetaceae bacterium]
MKKFFTDLVVLTALLLAAGTLFAAGGTETEAPEVIKIGASVSLSGNLARFGNMVKSGYELWAEQVNAEGGINVGGKKLPVEIVYYDDQSDNQTSAKLTEKLITEDKVQFLLGPFGSGPTFATTAIAEKYNIITMATLANATNIYDRGFQNVYAVLAPATRIFASFIDMLAAQSPKPTKVAIIYPNDNFPGAVAKGAEAYAKQKGFDVVYIEEYTKGVKDLSSTILKIKNSGAEVLMGSGYLEEAILTVRQLNEQKVRLKAIGFTTGPELKDFTDNLGSDANNIFGVSWWMPEMNYSDALFGSASDYADLYANKFGEGLSYQAAAASQGGLLLQTAIEKAGSLETDKVREALRSYSGSTFWGPTKWDSTGQNMAGATVTFQIQNGVIKTVFPPEAGQAKPIYPMP